MKYTPLKKVSPIAIFVGALPGAIPCLLGWVAATDDFGLAAGILFAIQFFWQFPHFIAISLILEKEYQSAGFRVMIKNKNIAAFVATAGAFFMTATSVIPLFFEIADLKLSFLFGIIVFALGIYFSFINLAYFGKKEYIYIFH